MKIVFHPPTAVACLFFWWLGVVDTSAGETYPWKVGLASANITPDEPVRMAGYGSKEREQPLEGIESKLFAKAMAIEDSDGHRALIITTDLIGLNAAVSAPIYQRMIQETGLRRDQILINSSHTHCGPVIGLEESKLSHFKNADHVAATLRYSSQLADSIVDISKRAIAHLEPVSLSWGLGVATFVMNRREFTDRGVRLGFNPRGTVDRSVPVMKVASTDGAVRCVFFGTACHNTTLGGQSMKITGDYAGYAQQFIEQKLSGSQAMFMQGCGGDANPFPRDSEEIARIHGMTLGKEILRVLETELTPIRGPLNTILQPVTLPLQTSISQGTIDKMQLASGATRRVAEELQSKLKTDGTLPSMYQTHISLWQFGDDLTLVGLPGEVVVDYVRLIEDAIGPRKLWISAYNHDVFGYLPSARVLREGGYEMRGVYSGGIGIFSSDTEGVVVNAVRELAGKAGRVQ